MNVLKKILKKELVSVGIYTSFSTIGKIIASFIVQKIIAVQIGPSGIALLAQFQNFITISTTMSSLGINRGVVRYVAEYNSDDDFENLKKTISTSTRLTLFSSLLVSVLTLIFSFYISDKLFYSGEYTLLIILFAISIPFFTFYNQFNSIVNGFRDVKAHTYANLTISISTIFISVTSTFLFGLKGAIAAISITQVLQFFIILLWIKNKDWFSLAYIKGKIDQPHIKKITAFSALAVTSFILPAIFETAIRQHIVSNLSITDAGLWDGINKISQGYFAFIVAVLSFYYLPKFSATKTKFQFKKEAVTGLYIVYIPYAFMLLAIFVFKENIILALYNQKMIGISALMLTFLIGDFFRLFTHLITVLFMSKSHIKLIVFLDVSLSIINYLITIYLIDNLGLIGASYAYMIKFIFRTIVFSFIFYFLYNIIFKNE